MNVLPERGNSDLFIFASGILFGTAQIVFSNRWTILFFMATAIGLGMLFSYSDEKMRKEP